MEYWRSRAVRLDAIAEQLAGAEHRAVAAVCTAAAVPACGRWRELELRLADAAAEARETLKYLTTLEGSLQCIYTSAWGRLSVAGAVPARGPRTSHACLVCPLQLLLLPPPSLPLHLPRQSCPPRSSMRCR